MAKNPKQYDSPSIININLRNRKAGGWIEMKEKAKH